MYREQETSRGVRAFGRQGACSFSVVIAVLNEAGRINDLIEGIRASQRHQGYEIIVVDGDLGERMKTVLLEAFDDITWSTDSVFGRTMQIFNRHKRTVHVLPQWHDVDTLGDLKLLVRRSENSDFSRSQTLDYINSTNLGDI